MHEPCGETCAEGGRQESQFSSDKPIIQREIVRMFKLYLYIPFSSLHSCQCDVLAEHVSFLSGTGGLRAQCDGWIKRFSSAVSSWFGWEWLSTATTCQAHLPFPRYGSHPLGDTGPVGDIRLAPTGSCLIPISCGLGAVLHKVKALCCMPKPTWGLLIFIVLL